MRERLEIRRPFWAAVVILVALIAGCAAIDRELVKFDSPLPISPAASASGYVCARDEDGKLQRLKPEQSCFALVRAPDWYSTTNLLVRPGWSVEVEVPPGQLWYDDKRVSIAPHGDEGSFVMKLFGGLKRHKEEPYFALMTTVVRCEPVAGGKPGLRQCTEAADSQPMRLVHATNTLFIAAEGELAFYVNDAVLPWHWEESLYRNNKGQIWVRVTMLRGPT